MKKLLVKSSPAAAWLPLLRRSRQMFGAFLATTFAANAEVSLQFDTNAQGVTAGSNASSVVWDSVGQRLEVNTTGGWSPQSAFIDLNSTDPSIIALRAEFNKALINGGTLTYDIIVETTSVTSTDPLKPVNPGWFETMYVGNSSAGWDQTFGGGKDQIAAYGAFPLSVPLLHTVNYTIEAASSVASDTIAQFGANSGFYQINIGINSESGTTIKYYLDNIAIAANLVAAPLIIPNVTITPAVAGLNMISSGNGQYDRQCVRTSEGTDVSWVGGTFPKTYELTIADYPKVAGYESVIYFVPGSGISSTNSSPDWSEALCAGLWIYPNGDGSGAVSFRYKDGPPNSNGVAGYEYWVNDPAPSHGLGGQLANTYSASFLGTWKITFTSDTDFTLTVPDGTTSSGSLNPATAAKFAGPMYVYFGNVPSQAANIGRAGVYSRIKITGTGYPIDENFAMNPMSPDLVIAASVPASVVQVTPDVAKYWINWTLPATDFQLQQSTNLSWDSWTDLPSPVTHTTKFGKARLLLVAEVTSPTTEFFRLVRPGTVAP